MVDTSPHKRSVHAREETCTMSTELDEGMLVRHIDLSRNAKLSDNTPSRLMILIEHMDGTDYMVGVTDRSETPEHLTALLAAVACGADMMIRALDALRAVGYMDARPLALLGREIVFGLDRVTLELEIMENSDGEINCGISVSGVDQEKIEEIGSTLEEHGIDVV
nr:MAG TPA: hypothetical protein [Caudoviricetes sp.]